LTGSEAIVAESTKTEVEVERRRRRVHLQYLSLYVHAQVIQQSCMHIVDPTVEIHGLLPVPGTVDDLRLRQRMDLRGGIQLARARQSLLGIELFQFSYASSSDGGDLIDPCAEGPRLLGFKTGPNSTAAIVPTYDDMRHLQS